MNRLRKHKADETRAVKSSSRLHFWQKRSINLSLAINRKRFTLRVRFIEPSRRARIFLRLAATCFVVLLVFGVIMPTITLILAERTYALNGSEEALLPQTDPVLQKDISYNSAAQSYSFANSDTGSSRSGSQAISGGPMMITATIPTDPTKGITVVDPVNSVDFTVTPEFSLTSAKQSTSHIYYPFQNGNGQLVYSPEATDMQEDLVLRNSPGNSATYNYQLGLGGSMVAQAQSDGSINIYGSELTNFGNVSTDNAKDAKLLANAEQKAQKNKLLFTIPAPTVKETNRGKSVVHAYYTLSNDGSQGTILHLTATNLDSANYPVDIDPTVSVQSVSQIYRDTNGESNVDFNTTNGSINRGAVTGGVFSDTTGWTTNSNSLNTGRFLDSAVVSNGYIYVAGGAPNNSVTNITSTYEIEYAQISTVNNTIGAWHATSNLPAALSQFRLLTYNGYLYELGGSTTSTGCGTATANVYYNPTQPNGALAANWTSTTALPTAICSFGAAIYNNKIYVVGGQSGSGTTHGSTTYVYYAPINPDGSIGTWTTTTTGTYQTPALPAAVYGDDVQIYNNYIYVIGGMVSTGVVSTIYEAALSESGANAGSIYGSWTSLSNTFANADGSVGITNLGGGSFSTVNDGYMYVSGGCTVVATANMNCTTGDESGNTYVAQINADGTLGTWQKIASTNTDTEVGGSLLVFSGYLYVVVGCSVMNAAVSCATGDVKATQVYAQIQSAGQIGPIAASSVNLTPTDGLYQDAAVVNGGYLYAIGGCLTASCDAGGSGASDDTSSAIYYAAISSNGSIGSWATSSYTINAGTTGGLGAIDEAATVYDGYVYIFGGYNYTGGTHFQTTSSASNVVWYAQFSTTSHDLTANFSTYATALAQGTYSMSATSDRGYAYAFGGCQATQHSAGCSTYYRTAYTLQVGTSGPVASTLVATANNLPEGTEVVGCTSIGASTTINQDKLYTLADCYPGLAAMGITFYNGYIYLVGGASGSPYTGNGQSVIIEYSHITTPGTIGSWSTATSYLPYSSTGNGGLGYYAALRRTAAFAFNDYLYVVGGHDGDIPATSPNIDIGQINLSTGNITSEVTSSQVLVDEEWDGGVAYADGTVYVVGGCYNGAPPTTCSYTGGTGVYDTKTQTFQLYNADNAGTASWNNASNTYGGVTTNSTGSSAVAYNGYLYTAGGCTATFSLAYAPYCGTVTNTSAYATLNPDGTVGTWTAGPSFTTATGYGCMLEANGYLYYIGGQTTGSTIPAVTTVYDSLIGASGVPGSWSTASIAVLGAARTQMGCDSFAGTLYVVGGTNGGASPTPVTTVYYTQPNSSNGQISSWSSFGTGLTTGRVGLSAVAAGGYLYAFGGDTSTTYYNEADFIGINPSTGNSTGSWGTTSVFPTPTSFMGSAVANGYIFLFGGNTSNTVAAASCSTNTYMAPILSTGSLGPWSQGVNSFTTARTGPGSAYYNGYYYVMGGDNCTGTSDIFTSNVIQYGGEQSEAMAGFFTRYADLGGDAAPELFLAFVTNAQNNSVNVEYWKMSYVTSNQTTNSWGVTTTINPVTSGTVSTVYAYNGSGTNVYLDRYIQINFSISMIKSFTFPDSTQPSVNSYFLYYSPAPGLRLRNGADFQDEQQQGLDLNY